jgi:hypothetical protein
MDDVHLERRPMRLASSSGLLMERPHFNRRRLPGGRPRVLDSLLTPLSPLLALVRAQGLSAASRWAMLRALTQLRLSNWRTPSG